jgi:WD40 repeat protein
MTSFTHSLAIVIGIDAYDSGIPRLTTAVNDAARLADLLRASHGYETILLTEPETNQPVTRDRLAALFTEELPARLGDDDRLLVYFAGHGVALDGDDGPRGYLVPQDARPGDSASMLAMTDLHAWLTALPCRHMLAILDCCFAGAFRWSATRDLGAPPDVIHKERYDRYLLSPAWQVLTSAAYDQKALDVLGGSVLGRRETNGRQHSPFALALFDALEQGAADLIPKGQGDGVITATELSMYLREQVEVQAEAQAGHEQTPQLWPLNKHRKGEFIFLVPGHPLNLPPAPDLTAELNPYRGLKSYDQEHSQLFFGREDEITELVQRVDAQPFLAVLGASGTGKSSLVKAGVLPRLEVRSDDFSRPAPAEATEASSEGSEPVATANQAYRVLPPMRPTDQPVRALAALLHAGLDPDPAGFGNPQGLADGDDALAQVIAYWADGHPNERLVLTIDQFEELATLCRDDAERERFLRLLTVAVQQQPAALRLIITLRTDFEPQFTQAGSPLAQLWQAGRYVVPPMDIEDLRQVIEGPASVRVLYFEPPELVNDLIKEVIQTPGALPLLSFTLSELYVKYVQSGRDDRALSGADYQALGGVVGSLRNRASEEYDRLLDDAHRATMQRVMLRMVAVEGGGELARRRVALSELDYPTEEENARVQAVLDRLVDARLLVRDTAEVPDGTKGEAYVEPAHDALVLAWDKLLRWKKEAEEYLPLQRRLAQATSEWSKAASETRSGLLWDDDPRLPQVEETLWPTGGRQTGLHGRLRWARQLLLPRTDTPADTKWLNEAELAFAQDSVQARAQFWRRVLSAATVFVLVLIAATAISLGLQSRAVKAETTAKAAEATAVVNEQIAKNKQAEAIEQGRIGRHALAQQLAAQTQDALVNRKSDPSLALILARQATLVTWQEPSDHYVTVDAERALAAAIDAAPPYLMTLPRHGHADSVLSAAYSPDGRYLVTSSADQTARIWDASTGLEVRQLTGHAGPVNAATFSPDGTQIFTGGDDRTARIWDASTGLELRRFTGHTGAVSSAAYSPDGRQIVTASADQTVLIWDAATGQEVRTLSGHTGPTRSVAYSPDGKQIVTAGCDGMDQRGICQEGSARIWDATTGQEVVQLGGHIKGVNSAAYSPDGKQVVTAGCDGTSETGACVVGSARIWDAATGKEVRTLSGHAYDSYPSPILSAAYSPDGKTIVIVNTDQTVSIWDAAKGQEVRQLTGHNDGVNSAAYSPDGTQIVTASKDKTARIWDADTGQDVRTLGGHTTHSAAYSPDGKQIVTAGCDRTDQTGACQEGSALVWDVATGQEVRKLSGHTGSVNSVTYSPDGKQIVTASSDTTARIWDAATGREVHILSGHSAGVNSAVYSPNGKQVVTASDDQTARFWDAATGREVRTLSGHGCGDYYGDCSVNSAAYSPNGKQIVTASSDQTARIWDAATGEEVRKLSSDTGPVYSAAYSPNGKQIVTAGCERIDHSSCLEGSARIWDAATGQKVRTLNDHIDAVNSAAFSPDGKQIVTAGCDRKHWPSVCEEGSVRIWDAATGQEVRQLSGHTGVVLSVAYSPDGKQIVTASDDQTARIWDTTTRHEVRQLSSHTGPVRSVAFSPDGKQIVTAGCDRTDPTGACQEDSVRIWDAATERTVRTLTGHTGGISSAAYSPDGKQVVTAGCGRTDQRRVCQEGSARIWDAATGEELHTLTGHTDQVNVAVYSPNGKQIVTASRDGTARIWDASTGRQVLQLKSDGWVWFATYSPDGRHLVTGSQDRTTRIWDASTGQEVLKLISNGCNEYDLCGTLTAAYSPDGKHLVTAGYDYTARIWDTSTWEEVSQLTGITSYVYSATYSPDGKYIVTTSKQDKIARIWDAATGREVRSLSGHTDDVNSAAYSLDGKYLVTASADQTIRVWPTNFDDLLAEADRLIQRDPPLLTPEERRRYGLE